MGAYRQPVVATSSSRVWLVTMCHFVTIAQTSPNHQTSGLIKCHLHGIGSATDAIDTDSVAGLPILTLRKARWPLTIDAQKKLPLGALFQTYWLRVSVTWLLTLVETALFALMPLLIGRAIDGLIADPWPHSQRLPLLAFSPLLVTIGRRVCDTRTYSGIRVDLGCAQAERGKQEPVSVVNARVLMGRELIDFMEETAPEAMTALVQVIASIVVLLSFHSCLACSPAGAVILMLCIYGLSSRRFYRLNGALNEASEGASTCARIAQPQSYCCPFHGFETARSETI